MILPKTTKLLLNGKKVDCVEIKAKEERRSAPTILYKVGKSGLDTNRYYITLTTWANIKFGIHAHDAYFYTDRDTKKRELRILIDYPNTLSIEGICKLQDYNDVEIHSGLDPEYQNPFIAIVIKD